MVLRATFHEITESAIKQALADPDPLDINLVRAQEARRVVDRLMGHELGPFVSLAPSQRGLSAGRMQSVALQARFCSGGGVGDRPADHNLDSLATPLDR